MDFIKQKPIYLQMADRLCERIMAGEWGEDERIPSVRDLAVTLGVNPNTAMRTFDYLQGKEIIYNHRGVGYFVSPKAKERIFEKSRQCFLEEELPEFVQKMKLLGFTWQEVMEANNPKNKSDYATIL